MQFSNIMFNKKYLLKYNLNIQGIAITCVLYTSYSRDTFWLQTTFSSQKLRINEQVISEL